MANIEGSINQLMQLTGALGASIVDSNSGMMLGSSGNRAGTHGVDLEVAAAGNTEVVRSKRKTMEALGLSDSIEDILITLGKQYHLIRLVSSDPALFIYFVLDRNQGNLALARHKLAVVERELRI